MIGCGDRDGVNVLVFEQLTNIDVGFWLCHAQLLHIPEALVQDAFIHVAQSGNLRSRDTGESVDVIFAATSYSANGHAHTISGAYDPGVAGRRGAQGSTGDTCAGDFQEVPPR